MKEFKLFTLYDHPKDFPNHYVVREFYFHGAEFLPKSEVYLKHTSLEEIQKEMEKTGLAFLYRMPDDDPVIIGVWM